jgi:hypothetical protein
MKSCHNTQPSVPFYSSKIMCNTTSRTCWESEGKKYRDYIGYLFLQGFSSVSIFLYLFRCKCNYYLFLERLWNFCHLIKVLYYCPMFFFPLFIEEFLHKFCVLNSSFLVYYFNSDNYFVTLVPFKTIPNEIETLIYLLSVYILANQITNSISFKK